MIRRLALAALLLLAASVAVHAQQSSWLWWGTNSNTAVPVSTANPLPVTAATADSIVVGATTITGGTTKGLLYDNAGVLGNLATGNNGVLITSAAGVPSISTTVPTGLAATSLALTNPTIAGNQTTTPTAVVSAALDQTAATAATFLAFVNTTGMAVGQQVSGTNIPIGDQIASIVSNAQVTLTANGISASGQKVLTTTATTGATVGQLCVDLTTPTAIGTGNTIASVQAGVSITMTINLAANTANSDSIVCDPTVTLTGATTSAPSGTMTFYANAQAPASTSAIVDLGDASVYGNLLVGGAFALTGTALPTPAVGTLGVGGIAAKPTMGADGEGAIYLTSTTGGLTFIGRGSTTDILFQNKNGTNACTLNTGTVTLSCGIFTPLNSSAPTVGMYLPAAGKLGLAGTTSELFSGATDVWDYGVSTASVFTVPVAATFSNAAVKMTAITTGTNADTVCLKADGTLLIQAAACTISSLRFKNLRGAYAEGHAVGTIAGLQPIVFTMKEGDRPNPDYNYDKVQIGLSAENVAAIEPRCAIYEQDGSTPKSYRQECLIAVLVAAVKTQQHEIDALKTRHR